MKKNKIYNSISASIRTRLNRRKSGKKGKSTFKDILPYTVDELMFSLESLFEPGMSWENHGFGDNKWHIDHVVPDSWFEYTNIEDEGFKNSWALENLQPMWQTENLMKNNNFAGKWSDRNKKENKKENMKKGEELC